MNRRPQRKVYGVKGKYKPPPEPPRPKGLPDTTQLTAGRHRDLDPATRQELRRQQLEGSRVAERDPDLDGYWRRQYQLQDGTTNQSEPHVLPPRDDLRKPRVIESDPDLDQEDPDLDPTAVVAAGPIVPLTATDQAIRKVDDLLTDLTSKARSLREAANALMSRVRPTDSDEAIHGAEQILWIVEEAVLPWLREIDQNFDSILAATPEGGQPQGQSL